MVRLIAAEHPYGYSIWDDGKLIHICYDFPHEGGEICACSPFDIGNLSFHIKRVKERTPKIYNQIVKYLYDTFGIDIKNLI